jgi:hypothetical protein
MTNNREMHLHQFPELDNHFQIEHLGCVAARRTTKGATPGRIVESQCPNLPQNNTERQHCHIQRQNSHQLEDSDSRFQLQLP